MANLARIVASVALPVSVDLESGYGDAPNATYDAASAAIATGAIGFNLEDQIVGGLACVALPIRHYDSTRRAKRRMRQACQPSSMRVLICS